LKREHGRAKRIYWKRKGEYIKRTGDAVYQPMVGCLSRERFATTYKPINWKSCENQKKWKRGERNTQPKRTDPWKNVNDMKKGRRRTNKWPEKLKKRNL